MLSNCFFFPQAEKSVILLTTERYHTVNGEITKWEQRQNEDTRLNWFRIFWHQILVSFSEYWLSVCVFCFFVLSSFSFRNLSNISSRHHTYSIKVRKSSEPAGTFQICFWYFISFNMKSFFLKIFKTNQTEVASNSKSIYTALILKRQQRRNTHSSHKRNWCTPDIYL